MATAPAELKPISLYSPPCTLNKNTSHACARTRTQRTAIPSPTATIIHANAEPSMKPRISGFGARIVERLKSLVDAAHTFIGVVVIEDDEDTLRPPCSQSPATISEMDTQTEFRDEKAAWAFDAPHQQQAMVVAPTRSKQNVERALVRMIKNEECTHNESDEENAPQAKVIVQTSSVRQIEHWLARMIKEPEDSGDLEEVPDRKDQDGEEEEEEYDEEEYEEEEVDPDIPPEPLFSHQAQEYARYNTHYYAHKPTLLTTPAISVGPATPVIPVANRVVTNSVGSSAPEAATPGKDTGENGEAKSSPPGIRDMVPREGDTVVPRSIALAETATSGALAEASNGPSAADAGSGSTASTFDVARSAATVTNSALAALNSSSGAAPSVGSVILASEPTTQKHPPCASSNMQLDLNAAHSSAIASDAAEGPSNLLPTLVEPSAPTDLTPFPPTLKLCPPDEAIVALAAPVEPLDVSGLFDMIWNCKSAMLASDTGAQAHGSLSKCAAQVGYPPDLEPDDRAGGPDLILALTPVEGGRPRMIMLHSGTSGVLGRMKRNSPDHPMFFNDMTVSSRHAWVWASNGKIMIQDAGSVNGTCVNGRAISQPDKESDPHELHTGDILEIGKNAPKDNGNAMHTAFVMRVQVLHTNGTVVPPPVAVAAHAAQMPSGGALSEASSASSAAVLMTLAAPPARLLANTSIDSPILKSFDPEASEEANATQPASPPVTAYEDMWELLAKKGTWDKLQAMFHVARESEASSTKTHGCTPITRKQRQVAMKSQARVQGLRMGAEGVARAWATETVRVSRSFPNARSGRDFDPSQNTSSPRQEGTGIVDRKRPSDHDDQKASLKRARFEHDALPALRPPSHAFSVTRSAAPLPPHSRAELLGPVDAIQLGKRLRAMADSIVDSKGLESDGASDSRSGSSPAKRLRLQTPAAPETLIRPLPPRRH